MDSLRQKLESRGLKDVVYMVINHQGAQAQNLHGMLEQRLSGNITLYKQLEHQPDVWQTLNGEKDDFLIYDRCGLLTHHISLPYSIIGQGHVEGAIKDTYCKHICEDCIHEAPEECKAVTQPDADAAPAVEEDTGHHHGHHHGNGHGHHGDHQGFHPRGVGHGHDHNHGHHHGNHDGHDQGQGQSQQGVGQQGLEQDSWVSQRQQNLELGQAQQAVQIHPIPQEALGVPHMERP